jgi:uroporphyrinogen III methyltransferase/synthase
MGASAPGRILLPRAARARDALPDALRQAGWAVDAVAAYETRPAPREVLERVAAELEGGRIDAVLFTSGSAVESLCDALGPEAVGLLGHARIASIGPVTTEAARARGLRVDVTAAVATLQSLIEALAASYSSRGQEPVA